MPDISLTRAYDGRCTVFVGDALVFTNLDEAQAEHLMRAFGGDPIPEAARETPRRSTGGRPGRLATRKPLGVADAALASLR